jgi:AcrR family transcriptional regulator
MATRRNPRRPYHHGNLRLALLREAGAILRSEGSAALSLREVARRAGVSPAAPYAHFADKGELLAALAEEGFRDLVTAMRRGFREAPADPLRRLKAMTGAYVRFAVEHPARFAIMFGPERPPIEQHAGLHEAAHDASGVMVTAIVDCQQSGAIVAGDAMALAVFGWTVIHGLSVLLIAGLMPAAGPSHPGRGEVARLADAVMERAIAGLAPRPGHSPPLPRKRRG